MDGEEDIKNESQISDCWVFDGDIPWDGDPGKGPGFDENHHTFVYCTPGTQN